MKKPREARSPYARYGKTRWVYSPLYQLWREAALTHGFMSEKALVFSCQHAKKMQVHNCACEPDARGCHVTDSED